MIPKLCFNDRNSKNNVCRYVTILLNTVLFSFSIVRPVRWVSSIIVIYTYCHASTNNAVFILRVYLPTCLVK